MTPTTIAVAGNVNADLSYTASRLPEPGETLVAEEMALGPGGKAANQSVALARLGARARLIGCVGEDAFGRMALANLRREGVDTGAVTVREGATSGAASVFALPGGENAIVTALGANMMMEPEDIPTLSDCDGLLMTLGLPEAVLLALLERAGEEELPVLLDATPLRRESLPRALTAVEVLSANRVEAERLGGRRLGAEASPEELCELLLELGARRAVLKLGGEGAVWHDGESMGRAPSPPVRAVDSTGAGDAFMAALCKRFLEGDSLEDSTRFACVAGALATTGRGAQAGLSSLEQVERLLAELAAPRSET